MFRKLYLILTVAILAILAVTPAYASPSLSLGSNATYGLSGKIVASNNCTAVPLTYAAAACSGTIFPPSNVTLNGAGSTFVYPLISAISASHTSVNPSVRINYQAAGSETGVNELQSLLVDFAASDAPLSQVQFAALNATSTPVTIPETIGAVVVAYNLPGVASGLHLNANVTAEIFQGNITSWNDPAIEALNPGIALPTIPITIVHRSDASGTTFVFSSYLNSSPLWKLGQSKTILWPVGSIGANGNTGDAAIIQGTKYTVGYVELDYALSAIPAMSYAYMLNRVQGAYIQPTLASTSLAVSSLPSLPANDNWTSVNLLNSPTPGAYPIASFSYLIVYKELSVYGSVMTQNRALALLQFLSYVVNAGQTLAPSLNYVPLPSNVVSLDNSLISSITYFGQPPSTPSPPSPPAPTTIQVDLVGTLGWNVEGLSGSVTNLLVSHQASVSVPVGFSSFSPVSESGSFEQSINLATRVESPGTAASLAGSLLTSTIPNLTGAGLGAGSYGSTLQTMLSGQSNNPEYTQWWVNGPLSQGSPVQMLQGWSSVTGSENLNLGGNIGSRSGWTLTSQLSQSVNTTIPSGTSSAGSSSLKANLNLLSSFDKTADLLIHNIDTLTLTMDTVAPTTIYIPPYKCGSQVCGGSLVVTVTHNMTVLVSLEMLLTSTNINLNPTARGHSASTVSGMIAAMPWMPIGVAAIAAGVIAGVAVWLTRRASKPPALSNNPIATPPSGSDPPSP